VRPLAIHQFHASSSYGDGITNGMLFIQTILRDSGYGSEIFCGHVDPRFAGRMRPINSYPDRADDLLLVHYSLGTPYEAWIENRKSPRVLIYHNITPAHFFPKGSELHVLAQSGRARLAAWAKQDVFAGAIADSAFNAAELLASRYLSVAAIPLLVDLDRIRQAPWNQELSKQLAGARNLLFVGRLCENKGQLDLIKVLAELTRICASPVRLILVGNTMSPDYKNAVVEEIERRGLGDRVLMLGQRDDRDIYALYRCCDLYCSMSQHEGFGMPLVESMAFDLPVLACAAGAVAATLASGGLVLESGDPDRFAGTARLLLEEPWLRREVIFGQRRALGQYERAPLVRDLQNYLGRIGFDVSFRQSSGTCSRRDGVWSIEGPFDSSYSLSIINRELARGLSRAGETVALISRDGPGPFEPNQKFLAEDAEVRDMWCAGKSSDVIDVNLRNQYPPSVADMRGAVRGLAIYNWEESAFPERYVTEFNSTLNLVTVASRFVAKVLRDNGVDAPIRVVGVGCDHVLDAAASDSVAETAARPFRFLHVSSCFPRKAADVLLTAWVKAFCSADPVELVIKTFPNEHNRIEDILAEIDTAHPRHAPIRLINRDVELEELRRLYRDAHAVVCASRGEGFGLPLAEALALGKPVIATAYGGQVDFCTPQNAWLCDYSFAYARTHLAVASSVWTEPDVESLAGALRECFSSPVEERMRRAQAGRALVRSQFSWAQVAKRTQRAVEEVSRWPASVLRLPKIGLISTWNSRCGVATYSKWLVGEIAPERLIVFADRTATLVEPDEEFVHRSWTQGFDDPLDDLYGAISAAAVDAVVVQVNLGFFRLQALAALIDRLVDRGILVFVCLHSTIDVDKPDVTIRLQEAKSSLARACRLLVHSVHDLNRLKALGLVDNVTLFPHGAATPVAVDRDQVRRDLRLTGKPVLATFGYLLPHKGLRELIRAFALVKQRQGDAHLLMLNALYPVPQSAAEHQACLAEIKAHGLENCVTLTADYLPEHDVLARLQVADMVVFPYQQTQESASGAVRLGLASLVPVACTPLPIFDDVSNATYQLSGITPEAIADGITTLWSNETLRSELAAKQKAWLAAHAWPTLSRRLMGLIRGEFIDRYATEPSRNRAPVGSAESVVVRPRSLLEQV
jgi:glycosyltransferase involved in cell wall biosynthesis